MSSPLVGVAVVNAFLFGVYGNALALLEQKFPHSVESPNLINVFIAGGISGCLNSFISTPTELAKIVAQSSTKEPVSPLSVLVDRYKFSGMRGCFLGFFPTVLRETPSYAVYFFAYEYLCRRLSPTGLSVDCSNVGLMLAGGVSGALAWVSTYPADVIKTAMQAQIITSEIGYRSRNYIGTLQTANYIVKVKGWPFLFRGMDATLLRAFPTNAAIFWAYSTVMSNLQKNSRLE
jgi:solute carrier family 25 (mitochondrial carnitine/acylcarnitine transporter), member 20/29